MLSAAISSSSRNPSETFARVRRLIVVLVVLALLWPFARPLLAETLVERSMGSMVLGDYATAGTYINRALWLDSDVADAVDASAFLQTFGANKERLKQAETMLNAYLVRHPNDANARWDRMLLEMRLEQFADAYADQQIITRLLPDNQQIVKVGQALRARLARK